MCRSSVRGSCWWENYSEKEECWVLSGSSSAPMVTLRRTTAPTSKPQIKIWILCRNKSNPPLEILLHKNRLRPISLSGCSHMTPSLPRQVLTVLCLWERGAEDLNSPCQERQTPTVAHQARTNKSSQHAIIKGVSAFSLSLSLMWHWQPPLPFCLAA